MCVASGILHFMPNVIVLCKNSIFFVIYIMLQVILTVKSGLISLDSLQNDGRTRFSAHFCQISVQNHRSN